MQPSVPPTFLADIIFGLKGQDSVVITSWCTKPHMRHITAQQVPSFVRRTEPGWRRINHRFDHRAASQHKESISVPVYGGLGLEIDAHNNPKYGGWGVEYTKAAQADGTQTHGSELNNLLLFGTCSSQQCVHHRCRRVAVAVVAPNWIQSSEYHFQVNKAIPACFFDSRNTHTN